MSLIFYRAPMSTASLTEEILEELGVPHETVTIDIRNGGTKKPEFTKLNPNAKVPVIVHDGTVIWESAAITLYLGETFGVEKKLWPAAGPKRGEAMKWVVWANVTLAESIGRWMRNTKEWVPEEQRNAKAGEAGKKDMEECLRILDEALTGRDYVLGEHSLVDTHLASLCEWLHHSQVELARWSRVDAWSKRCWSRPAPQRVAARQQQA
jgi:glutathione S-transferase